MTKIWLVICAIFPFSVNCLALHHQKVSLYHIYFPHQWFCCSDPYFVKNPSKQIVLIWYDIIINTMLYLINSWNHSMWCNFEYQSDYEKIFWHVIPCFSEKSLLINEYINWHTNIQIIYNVIQEISWNCCDFFIGVSYLEDWMVFAS